MTIYVVNEYSLNYEYEFTPDYDDDWDDNIVERIDFVGSPVAFTNKGDAERWIAGQELNWDGQYEIEEVELR